MGKARCYAPQYTRTFVNWEDVPMVLSVKELCQVLKISDKTALKLLNDGVILGQHVGQEWRISRDAVRRYLEGDDPPQTGEMIVLLRRLVAAAEGDAL